MKIVDIQTANINFDQDGEAYFMVGETAYYLNEFMLMPHEGELMGVTHITNTGGIQVRVDGYNEEVEYSIFTE